MMSATLCVVRSYASIIPLLGLDQFTHTTTMMILYMLDPRRILATFRGG